ncbi:MAG: prepilin peptidase [Rhodospirillales bacterium]|nr:prepilin peptidase [Alphaproteobacteria bacterium]USO03738.1 MAG: prepilin peptidase [Rhodospirillales bacterium]
MLYGIAFLCLIGAVGLLAVLSVIDLKIRLLPNKYVLTFALLGLLFHFVTAARYLSPQDIVTGAALGFGSLYLLRMAANAYYKMDAFGLGDVKLMGAAGLWLGVDGILISLTLGAFAGLLHGLGYGFYTHFRDKTPLDFHNLAIPAGPGFAIGIVLTGIWIYQDFIKDFSHVFAS